LSDDAAPLVLIVEDERAQMELLGYNLQKQGYRVARASTGEEGLLQARERLPDLIVLDWMLPLVSGIEVCRRLKAQADTRAIPVIMLTARGEESDRIRGLDTGADDYVVKPYAIRELQARIRAMLRRHRASSVGETLSYGDLTLDSDTHRVTRAGQPIKLGPIEFRLLATLMEKPRRVYSRDRLLDRVWGREAEIDTRTVDVHVGRLRKALARPGLPNPIRTVRGSGYSLDLDD